MPILGAMGAGASRGFGFAQATAAGGGGDLYSFTSFTFTNAGATGRSGPTLSSCLSSYNTATYPWLTNTAYFNVVTTGYQRWTVPATGSYTINVLGAKGGDLGSNVGGKGANLTGTFSLTKGEILIIIVGQQGVTKSTGGSAGGGGGTFVVRDTGSTLLIAAGGGGGAANYNPTGANTVGMDAVTTTSGTAGRDGLNAGGTSGNGGSSSGQWSGAAGAGFNSNGSPAYQSGGAISNSQGLSYASGFLGGIPSPTFGYGSEGGFGGGGAGNWGAGAGGGYSGGGSDNSTGSASDKDGGGGGGSYNSGTSQTTGTLNSNHGSVIITKLALAPTFVAGSMKSPSGTYNLRATNGWTDASPAMFTNNNFDDGQTTNFSGIIPAGSSWYWNNVAYTTQIIGSNSFISWSGGQDITFYAGDQYWGTNGPNGTGNTNAGLGYKSGTTESGWKYFYMNLQGYQFAAVGNDRTWEAHFVYNSDNSIQYIEIIVPATVASPGSFNQGPANPTNYQQNLYTLAGNVTPASGVWRSTDKGITWTFLGSGKLDNIPL